LKYLKCDVEGKHRTCLGKFTGRTQRVWYRRNTQYFGHVAKSSAGGTRLTVLQGSMEGNRYHIVIMWRSELNGIEKWTGHKYIELKALTMDKKSSEGRKSLNSNLASSTLGGRRSTSKWV